MKKALIYLRILTLCNRASLKDPYLYYNIYYVK